MVQPGSAPPCSGATGAGSASRTSSRVEDIREHFKMLIAAGANLLQMLLFRHPDLLHHEPFNLREQWKDNGMQQIAQVVEHDIQVWH